MKGVALLIGNHAVLPRDDCKVMQILPMEFNRLILVNTEACRKFDQRFLFTCRKRLVEHATIEQFDVLVELARWHICGQTRKPGTGEAFRLSALNRFHPVSYTHLTLPT